MKMIDRMRVYSVIAKMTDPDSNVSDSDFSVLADFAKSLPIQSGFTHYKREEEDFVCVSGVEPMRLGNYMVERSEGDKDTVDIEISHQIDDGRYYFSFEDGNLTETASFGVVSVNYLVNKSWIKIGSKIRRSTHGAEDQTENGHFIHLSFSMYR